MPQQGNPRQTLFLYAPSLWREVSEIDPERSMEPLEVMQVALGQTSSSKFASPPYDGLSGSETQQRRMDDDLMVSPALNPSYD